jgi:hypothetical protein
VESNFGLKIAFSSVFMHEIIFSLWYSLSNVSEKPSDLIIFGCSLVSKILLFLDLVDYEAPP